MGYNMYLGESIFTVDAQYAQEVAKELEDYWYEGIFDEAGNIESIGFNGDRLSNEFEMFERIAPMVDDGCYLQMSGDCGDLWRWVFYDGSCYQIDAVITWPEIARGDEDEAAFSMDDGDAIFSSTQSQKGRCPVCGSDDLEYGSFKVIEDFIQYPWKCPVCAHEGFEYGAITFDGHRVLSYVDPVAGEEVHHEQA